MNSKQRIVMLSSGNSRTCILKTSLTNLQVVEDVPYVCTLATLDKYNCDFCAHGGDYVADTTSQ